jgi:ribosomal-protein-alanine N-acetyltransferase
MTAEVRALPVGLREMRHADLPAVAAIESASYEFPWSAGIFRDCLLAGYHALVLEQGGQVVGYAVMSLAAGEAHLLNICLSAPLRGAGHGTLLLAHMIRQARAGGALRMFLEVRPSNQPALALYGRFGFRPLGLRRAYYRARQGSEDAVVLSLALDGADGTGAPPG